MKTIKYHFFWMKTFDFYKNTLTLQGINAEKKEAKAEKDEAEKYQKLEQDLVKTLSFHYFSFWMCFSLLAVFMEHCQSKFISNS